MLTSSVVNSVTFKNLTGNYPNKSNTLYNDSTQGGFTVKKYYQKFNLGDTIPLQVVSDSATVPVLKSYVPYLAETINGTLVSSYIGDVSRYYYNFEIELDSAYTDKIVSFIITQNSDRLDSEPICVSDISEEIGRGDIKLIEYTNYDLNLATQGYFIDWTVLDKMFFYVESIGFYFPSGEVDTLEDVDSKTNIASKLFRGETFSTGDIPDYLCEKIIAASLLDFFAINNKQYNASDVGEPERVEGSALFRLTLTLEETAVVGLNSDDLGITQTVTPEDMIVTKRNNAVTSAGWQVEVPEGYMLHSIWIKHDTTSAAATSTTTCGTTIAGSDLIDPLQGTLSKTEYVTNWKQYSRHFLDNPDAATNIYFSVTGAGAIMNIIVNFDSVAT